MCVSNGLLIIAFCLSHLSLRDFAVLKIFGPVKTEIQELYLGYFTGAYGKARVLLKPVAIERTLSDVKINFSKM
jgi:hypothetical protein